MRYNLLHEANRDLSALDDDRRPLGKAALLEALSGDGREYAAAVNRELYGLATTQYEALVEAVLRLRQPHLSERLDPAGVGAVLKRSAHGRLVYEHTPGLFAELQVVALAMMWDTRWLRDIELEQLVT